MSLTILLDMDGPLADFATRCADVLEQPEKGTFGKNPPTDHDRIHEHFGFEEPGPFWQAIHRYPFDFWLRISPMPWCNILYSRLFNRPGFKGPPVICTSPARNPDCVKAKLCWLQQQFGGLVPFRDFAFIPSEHKRLLARPDHVLVDDRPSTIAAFREAGGLGYLFPMPWNEEGAQIDWHVRPGSPGYEIAILRPLLDCLDALAEYHAGRGV